MSQDYGLLQVAAEHRTMVFKLLQNIFEYVLHILVNAIMFC